MTGGMVWMWVRVGGRVGYEASVLFDWITTEDASQRTPVTQGRPIRGGGGYMNQTLTMSPKKKHNDYIREDEKRLPCPEWERDQGESSIRGGTSEKRTKEHFRRYTRRPSPENNKKGCYMKKDREKEAGHWTTGAGQTTVHQHRGKRKGGCAAEGYVLGGRDGKSGKLSYQGTKLPIKLLKTGGRYPTMCSAWRPRKRTNQKKT